MPDLDASMLRKGLLTESWYVALGDYIIDVAWSPDATKLAAVTVEGAVFLVEAYETSAKFKLIGEHCGGANSLSWRHDGAEFATAGHDGLAKVWDGASGQQLSSLEAGESWVSKTSYSPRRKVLATAAGKHLKLWNEGREAFYDSSDHASTITDVRWNPIGPGIAAAANDGITMHLSNNSAKPRKYRWKGSALVLQWSPGGEFLATGEQDATVHFLHLKSGRDAQMRGFPSKVRQLSWDPSGRWLATSSDSIFLLWDCSGGGPAGRQPLQYHAHGNRLSVLAFQPDGGLLASADIEAYLFLWDPTEHDNVIGGVLLSSPASCLCWCGGDKLAVGQQDGRVVVFEVRTVSKYKDLASGS
ncbi:MAG: WD40 repeat domain-containing protein [Planctomycetota bacterium]